MLVLSRKKFESLTITLPSGDVIVVKLCEMRPGSCRIGIDAPQSIKITRTELLEKDAAQ